MILFESDWELYPSAIVDYKTNNKSALRLAGLYKSMGISNHNWVLQLHNAELQGVDPYDPNLTQQQRIMVAAECKVNPAYYFREVARAPAISGALDAPFKLNRANMGMLWLAMKHITAILIQPRQTGKSFSVDHLMTLLLGIKLRNTQAALLTKDDDLRVKNISRLKKIYDTLPFYLKFKTKKDTNNTEKITYNVLGNVYNTAVPQMSPKAALSVGRGSTYAINHIDELPFIPNIDITLPALLATGIAARAAAKDAGEPYFNIFTTTAGYLHSKEGKYVYNEIYKKAMPWTEKLFDCKSDEELTTIIKRNSSGGKLLVLLEFNHRQLGHTDEWLIDQINETGATGDAILADFLNMWVEGSSTTPISKDLLRLINDSIVNEPQIDISEYGYITRWYIEDRAIADMEEEDMVVSLDTSDAVGKDDIALIARSIKSGATIAAGQFNETNLITFAQWVVEFILRYQKSTFIIERRSSGVMIIDYIIKLLVHNNVDPFKRLFNWVVNDALEYKDRANETIRLPMNRRDRSVYEKYRKYFGFATSGGGRTSRDSLYGNSLLAAIKYTGAKAADKNLVMQISELTVKNGRVDHKAGSNDDLVIAWVLSYWFLTNANNLEYYGININIVLSHIIRDDLVRSGDADKIEANNYYTSIKDEIAALLELFKEEANPIKSDIITNRIRLLYRTLPQTYKNNYNITNMIESIELEKNRTQRQY